MFVGDMVEVLEDHIFQIEGATLAQHAEQVENIFNVIVDAVSSVFSWADAANQVAELARYDRKGAQGLLKHRIVDVDEQNAIRECGKTTSDAGVPSRRARDHV